MSDSSETRDSFENLRVANLFEMIGLLSNTSLPDKGFIRRRYLERGTHFETTLEFLIEQGLVKQRGNELHRTPEGNVTDMRIFRHLLISRLLQNSSRFPNPVLDYVRQFHITGGRPIHRPTIEQRSAESGIRNFLMDLGMVSYDSENAEYILEQEHYSLFASAHRRTLSVPPATLAHKRRTNEDLGIAAEQEIVEFERKRIGERFAARVYHIASTDAAAGYDIESITINPGQGIIPRYIEVKAVSPGDHRFFWTANEVAVARCLRSWYFLYLLPIEVSGRFGLEKLSIICDPVLAVLAARDKWWVEPNVVECKMKDDYQ